MIKFLKFFSVGLLLGTSSQLQAQDSLKSVLSFQLGVAIPTGSFAKADAITEQQGFALPGFSANLELLAGSKAPIGWAFRVGLTRNPLRDSAYRSALDKTRSSTITNFTVEHGWRSTQFLTGPVFRIPTKRAEFNFKILGGLALARAPKFSFLEQTAPTTFASNQADPASTINFSFVSGVGVRLPFSPKSAVLMGVEYSSAWVQRNYDVFANQMDVEQGRVLMNNLVVSVGVSF